MENVWGVQCFSKVLRVGDQQYQKSAKLNDAHSNAEQQACTFQAEKRDKHSDHWSCQCRIDQVGDSRPTSIRLELRNLLHVPNEQVLELPDRLLNTPPHLQDLQSSIKSQQGSNPRLTTHPQSLL